MKLTEKERQTVAHLRELTPEQRASIMAYVHRQALANKVVAKIARIKTIRTVPSKRIERAFGFPVPRPR